jgi:hypothetical protein
MIFIFTRKLTFSLGIVFAESGAFVGVLPAVISGEL